MQVIPITAATPCFGMCCPRHSQCQRYAAVEHHTGDHVMDSCDPGDGSRPRFEANTTDEGDHHAASV